MGSVAIVRNENGQITKGSAALSPNGRAGSARTRIQRIIDARFEHGPNKITIAEIDAFVLKMKQTLVSNDDPELRRMVLDRIWPAVLKIETGESTNDGSADCSLEEWARLSEEFGTVIEEAASEDAVIVLEPTEASDP